MNYHQALMDRLSQIDDLGRNQTALNSVRQRPAFQTTGQMPSANAPSGFESFVQSIANKESGGNYGAVNRDSGAMGKYQIMPSNIEGSGRGWDREALGYDISSSQFMQSPQLQDAIAQYKLKQYYQQYGPAGAAVAWYAGPGAVSGYLKNPGAYSNPQGAYPSISSYANAIIGRM